MFGSSLLFYRAETLRYEKEAEMNRTFTIYSTYGYNEWFPEDYFALFFFLLAIGLLIYGVWLRNADAEKYRTDSSKIT